MDTHSVENKYRGKLDQTVQSHVLEKTEWCYQGTPAFPV